MEASQAGLAGGEAAQGEGEGTQGQQGPDVAALAEQLTGLTSSQEQMRQALAQIQESPALREQAEAVQEEHPGIDLSFLEQGADLFDPEQMKSAMEAVAAQTRDQVLQQHVTPLAQRIDGMQFEQDAARLFAEFPELGDPQVAEPLLKPGGLAEQMAMELGLPDQAAKDLATKPAFVRLAYMASRAAAAAQEEEGEQPNAAHLEGGSGARPGATPQGVTGQDIVNAGRTGSSVLPFG